MRIFEDYKGIVSSTIKVDSAEYVGNYVVKIKFNNNSEKMVDFKPFLSKSQHPEIRKYLNENLFSKYQIIDGNLNWNDYDMIFPVSDLYNGYIES